MPITLKQSVRFGVSLMVMLWSFKSKYSRISLPIGASNGSSNKPVLSAAKPSSFSEHSMPNDSTPRTLACLIAIPGNTAPTNAHGTLMPTRALVAPQTICNCSPPIFTLQTCKRSASGCFSAEMISAMTTRLKSAATGWQSSTSRPAIVKALLNACVSRLGFTNWRSQFSENCINVLLIKLR